MRYCDTPTMREQLAFLVAVASWPSVTIRVIPFAARITGSVHSMLYAGAALPALDTVQLDTAFDGGFLDAEAQLARYRKLLGAVDPIALSAEESTGPIRHIAQEM